MIAEFIYFKHSSRNGFHQLAHSNTPRLFIFMVHLDKIVGDLRMAPYKECDNQGNIEECYTGYIKKIAIQLQHTIVHELLTLFTLTYSSFTFGKIRLLTIQ